MSLVILKKSEIDVVRLSSLYEDEIKNMAAKRQDDFLKGRFVAHLASGLKRKISRGESGKPIFQGSISHSENYACAYYSDSGEKCGIDVEEIMALSTFEQVKHRLFSNTELALIAEYSNPLILATLLFSAKESVYKCFHGEFKRFIGFHEVSLLSVDWDKQEMHLDFGERTLVARFSLLDKAVMTLIKA